MGTLTIDSTQLQTDRLVAPSFQHALAFWWAFTWRSILWMIGVMIVLWVPLFGLQLFGALLSVPQFLFEIVAFAIGVAVQVYVFREILDKDFRRFKVCLVSKET
ncbi:MAG: hypothetical protein ACRD5G_10460 [Candidatus Acidiferrales bacterium]